MAKENSAKFSERLRILRAVAQYFSIGKRLKKREQTENLLSTQRLMEVEICDPSLQFDPKSYGTAPLSKEEVAAISSIRSALRAQTNIESTDVLHSYRTMDTRVTDISVSRKAVREVLADKLIPRTQGTNNNGEFTFIPPKFSVSEFNYTSQISLLSPSAH
jgi:hypothetical protein